MKDPNLNLLNLHSEGSIGKKNKIEEHNGAPMAAYMSTFQLNIVQDHVLSKSRASFWSIK